MKRNNMNVIAVEDINNISGDGKPLPYSVVEKQCEHEGCITRISGYRMKQKHKYCLAHAAIYRRRYFDCVHDELPNVRTKESMETYRNKLKKLRPQGISNIKPY